MHRIPGAILDGKRNRDHLSRHTRKKLGADDCDVRLRPPVSLEELCEEGYDPTDRAGDGWLQELREEAETLKRVEALFTYAAMALPPREYEVLRLYYREGLKLWEIGEGLGVTESRCSQLLKRAQDTLRQGCAQSLAG